MPLTALALVITAALIHALWNFAAKKSGGTTIFAFCSGLLTVIIWTPIVASYSYYNPSFNLITSWNLNQVLIIILSGAIHAVYYVILLKGYKVAPLSIVYPVARGTGPLISSFLALWIFDEKLTTYSFLGITLIIFGVISLSFAGQDYKNIDKSFSKGIIWGVFIGLSIATYTLVDAYGVKTLEINPLYFDYFTGLSRTIVLLPFVIFKIKDVKFTMKKDFKILAFVAFFSSFGYILVLTAMRLAPVSHIAPAREVSMLFGAFLGGKMLNEGHLKKRLIAASFIVAGVILLSFS